MNIMDAPNTSNLDDDMLDVDFISSQSSYSSSQDIQGSALTAGNAKMLEFIDATLNKVLSAISEGLSSEIILKRVTSMKRSAQGMDIVTEAASSVSAQVKHRRVTYTWPGRTLSEASRFSMSIGEAQFIMNHSTLQPIPVGLASCWSSKLSAVFDISHSFSCLIP